MKLKVTLIALISAVCTVAITVDAVPAAPGHAAMAKKTKKKCKKSKKKASAAKKKKCKKKRRNTPALPGPGGSTSPLPPPDPCPRLTADPATIYQVNQGLLPNGTSVRITDALVTAAMPDGSAFWVQVKGAAATDFSGLEVAPCGLGVPSPGLTVTIEGIVGTQSLTATQIQNTGAPIEPPGLRPVSAAFFADDANSAKLNGNLVGVSSPGMISSVMGGDWVMSTGFTVAHRIIGTLPDCANGTSFTQIVGIADIEGGDLVLLPASPSSIQPACS